MADSSDTYLPRPHHALAADLGFENDTNHQDSGPDLERDGWCWGDELSFLRAQNAALLRGRLRYVDDAVWRDEYKAALSTELKVLRARAEELRSQKHLAKIHGQVWDLKARLRKGVRPLASRRDIEILARDDATCEHTMDEELEKLRTACLTEGTITQVEGDHDDQWWHSMWVWERVNNREVYDEYDEEGWTAPVRTPRQIIEDREKQKEDFLKKRRELRGEQTESEERIRTAQIERVKLWRDLVLGVAGMEDVSWQVRRSEDENSSLVNSNIG